MLHVSLPRHESEEYKKNVEHAQKLQAKEKKRKVSGVECMLCHVMSCDVYVLGCDVRLSCDGLCCAVLLYVSSHAHALLL